VPCKRKESREWSCFRSVSGERARNIRTLNRCLRVLTAENVRTAFRIGWDLVSWIRAGPFYTPRLGYGVMTARGGRFSRLAIDETCGGVRAVCARYGRECSALFMIATVSRFYRVSGTTRLYPCMQVEDVKLIRKVLYYFANFAIINEILIFEDCRKRHVRPAYQQMQALGEIRPPRVVKRARNCLLRQ